MTGRFLMLRCCKKHPDVKNKLMIDEETRWISEKIFAYALQGNGAGWIMKALTREKVPTPGYLNFKRDGYIGNTIHYRETSVLTRTSSVCGKIPVNGCVWRGHMMRSLTRRILTGYSHGAYQGDGA